MSSNPDSHEVVVFLANFSRLKGFCDEDPHHLVEIFKTDDLAKALGDKVHVAALMLRVAEQQTPELFSESTNPEFIRSWRDYERRFEPILSEIAFNELFGELLGSSSTEPQPNVGWTNADQRAEHQARSIDNAIQWALDSSEPTLGDFPEGFSEEINEGFAAWNKLRQEVGFSLKAVFRRRELVPFVLFPRHVANKINKSDPLSLRKKLKEAHDAFIYGLPLASIALIRAIVETVLRQAYGSEGKDLSDVINNSGQLTKIQKDDLHRLRKLANCILHDGVDHASLQVDQRLLEMQIIAIFLVTRSLIEEAPPRILVNVGQKGRWK